MLVGPGFDGLLPPNTYDAAGTHSRCTPAGPRSKPTLDPRRSECGALCRRAFAVRPAIGCDSSRCVRRWNSSRNVRMTMHDWLARESRRYPRIRHFLLPLWCRLINLLWPVRKYLRRPVTYTAGSTTVMLYPEGQIPEALWKGGFEGVERDFVSAFVRPGMQVINVGANVGLYAVMASMLVRPDGEVHAFEPSTQSYSRLLANLELNGCRNVTSNQAALLDAPGQLLLRADLRHPSCDGHRFVEQVDAEKELLASDEMVQTITLDNYMKELSRPCVDLMIIDVEGAELPVLQGSLHTLREFRPTLLMECSRRHEDTERFLTELGYKFWIWDVVARSLSPADFGEAARHGNVVVRRDGWRAD